MSSPEELMATDLAKSGLIYQDMLTRVLDDASKSECGLSSKVMGYVIPYFDMSGKLLTFYRTKILNSSVIKYMQVKDSSNHVYFPKNFMEVFKEAQYKYVILTEGEKKAAITCKMGIPCVAFGGVDSWVNKTLIIPKNSEIEAYKGPSSGLLKVKLPSANFDDTTITSYAVGFRELLDLCMQKDTVIYIAYDTDTTKGCSSGPQRAAAKLGYELRHSGFTLNYIKQLVLPYLGDKTGLDDFIVKSGVDALVSLIVKTNEKASAFPVHPNVREYISKLLSKTRLTRKQHQNIAISLLTELDAKGQRMFSPDDGYLYYFDGRTNRLMRVILNTQFKDQINETDFGRLMYRDYNISATADIQTMRWMGTIFTGEDPLIEVNPHRIIARHVDGDDSVKVQLSNSKYIVVTGDPKKPYVIKSNGSDSILFESEMHNELDLVKLEAELKRQHNEPLKMWWDDVMGDVRLKNPESLGTITALLYYISPWLLRWRGTQLPVEIVVGEAGSGKSSLYTMRLSILMGDPQLRNTPKEYKDWTASISHAGGLYVVDNVHMTDKNLKQSISDDLCRLVTEPNPRVNMRKYYTTNEEMQVRVNTVFGFTAINHPFNAGDLIQRSHLIELTKPVELDASGNLLHTSFDGNWYQRQIDRFGGREAWMAHHLHVLHLFFKRVKERWNPNYIASNRLINLEQCMVLMAEVFGMEDTSWIPNFWTSTTLRTIADQDWTVTGLKDFADYQKKHSDWRQRTFTASEISKWAAAREEYEECFQLTNVRSLGKYLQSNKQIVSETAGIIPAGTKNNAAIYKVVQVSD